MNWRLARAQLALYEVCDQIIARRRASGSGGEEHLLGRHPEVQRRVRAEVDEVLGDRSPAARDVPALRSPPGRSRRPCGSTRPRR